MRRRERRSTTAVDRAHRDAEIVTEIASAADLAHPGEEIVIGIASAEEHAHLSAEVVIGITSAEDHAHLSVEVVAVPESGTIAIVLTETERTVIAAGHRTVEAVGTL